VARRNDGADPIRERSVLVEGLELPGINVRLEQIAPEWDSPVLWVRLGGVGFEEDIDFAPGRS
jgi:hypothetical protein